MIQRIQSLYLLMTTLLSLLFLNGRLLNFADKSGSVIKVTFTGILRDTGGMNFELIEKLLPLSTLLIIIPVISFLTIFIFKNRKVQLWLALTLNILVTGAIILLLYYSLNIIVDYRTAIIPGFKLFLPILMLIFSVLAYRGIRKDDRLVKSYDRLR
jgi:hypothetical protein